MLMHDSDIDWKDADRFSIYLPYGISAVCTTSQIFLFVLLFFISELPRGRKASGGA